MFIGSNLRKNTNQIQEFSMKNHDFKTPKASENAYFNFCRVFVYVQSILRLCGEGS
jgi:hypothetical protein